jgi:serine/threonine-protein kinase
MERTNLLSVGSNRIEIDDIHFVWRVPSGEINGGALFALNDNPLVRLTDCSITVDNPAFCKAVYAFDVVTDPEQISGRGAELLSRDDSVLPLVAIELNNVIARGQMGMIHMDYAAELQLNWDNGLLAISEPMIDTAGARVVPAATARPIQLWLTRLTAHTPKGLLRMRVGVSGAYPVSVDRFARSSVFVVDVGVPHFEFRGLESLPSDTSLLQLSGTTNAYDTDPTLAEPVLIVWGAQEESEMTRFNSLVSRWPDEVSPRWSVYWSEVRFSDAPMSRRTPADYGQDGSVRSGFDEKLLPILPDLSDSEASISRILPQESPSTAEREL